MISFYYQNVRSIKGKTNDFYVSVSACDYDIIALSETWLDESVHDNELFPADFTVYRCDRPKSSIHGSRGGGVLLAV